MKKISVIIPVYNVEKYLRECLDSVVNQTLKDIEIICINDASTDNSLQILEEYASQDNRIKIINNEKNMFAGPSRNKGLTASSGEYVYFMDSDDYLELNAMETVVNILDMNTDAAFCIFCKVFHDQTTNETTKIKTFPKKLINSGKISKICINTNINDILMCNVPAWTKVYRRSFLTENNIMFDDLKIANDRYFYFQTVFKAQKLILLEEYLINHRINVKNSLNSIRSENFECMYKSYEYVTSLYNNKNAEIHNIIIDLTIKDILYYYKKAPQKHKKKIKPKLRIFLKSINFPDEFDSYKNAIWYKWYCEVTNKYVLKRFISNIFSIKNSSDGIHKIITILGIKIKIKSKKLKEKEEYNRNICNLKRQISNRNSEVLMAIKRRTPQPTLHSIAVHLVDHCNLRCCGCDHFAPLAEKRFEDIEVFERDIKRFAELSGAQLNILKLMGGEPLLHPQLTEFMRIARQYLPNTRIEVVTNAILLNLQKENFWNACKEYNIVIVPTKYPLKTNYEKAEQTAESYGVKLEYYGNTNEVLKTSYHIPLDLEGKQNPVDNFIKCFHANNCVFLKEGKLYTCTVAPNINQFNKFFDKNIPLSDRDGIDIHKAQNIDEILEFLAKPIPFCKYCNVKGRTFGHKWGISKKEIEEWI